MLESCAYGHDEMSIMLQTREKDKQLWHQQHNIYISLARLTFRVYALQASHFKNRRNKGIEGQVVVVQAVGRGWLARRRYKAMKGMEWQRQKILTEVLSSEHKYHFQLSTIIGLFYTPLMRVAKEPESLFNEEDLKKIFSLIETVYSTSAMLLTLLEERVGIEGWVPRKTVADIFLRVAPYMKAMKIYFENYDSAVVHIQKLKSTSPEFAKFVVAAEKHPDCAKLDLLSLLITPIQRMPRYEMLLSALAQYTPESDPALEMTKRAAGVLQQVNKQINEGMRTDFTQRKMMDLWYLIDMQTRMGIPIPPSHQALLEAHRRLLRTGPITMCSLRDQSMQKRNLYLCNDLIITVTVVLNTPVKIDKVIPLLTAHVIENSDDVEGLSFFVVSPVKSHLFYCESRNISISWMKDIQAAITELIETSPENANRRHEWELEFVDGIWKMNKNGERDIIDIDSEEFEDSFVVVDHPMSTNQRKTPPPLTPFPAPSSPPSRTNALTTKSHIHFDPACGGLAYQVGADYLASHDGCRHVASESSYIILPPSIQFVVFISTGHVKLTNRGDGDIVLQAHRRFCSKSLHVLGKSFTLMPKSSQAFDFKGAWYIEVAHGRLDDLIVSELALSGGGKGNRLGMA